MPLLGADGIKIVLKAGCNLLVIFFVNFENLDEPWFRHRGLKPPPGLQNVYNSRVPMIARSLSLFMSQKKPPFEARKKLVKFQSR